MVQDCLFEAGQTMLPRFDGLQKCTPFAESFDRKPPLRSRPIFPRPSCNPIHGEVDGLETTINYDTPRDSRAPRPIVPLKNAHCARRIMRGSTARRPSRWVWAASSA